MDSKYTPFCVACALLAIVVLYLLYTSMYGSENFSGAGDEFVLYFAPWCGHCKNFMPVWDSFKTKHPVKLVKVNCDESGVCKERGVDGFPTMILYKNGKPYQYNGDRTIESLSEFLSVHYGIPK
jgi:thiol-disulfide isomerase/thioredoxin